MADEPLSRPDAASPEDGPPQSAPAWRRWARRIIQAALVVVALGYVLRTLLVNWDQLTARDVPFDGRWIALAVPFALVYVVCRGLLWHRIIQRFGSDLSARLDVCVWLVATLGKYLPGKIFMVVGRIYFYRATGLSGARVSLAFAYEVIALFTTALFFGAVGVRWPEAWGGRVLQALSLVGLVALMILSHPGLIRAPLMRFSRLRPLTEALPDVRPRDPGLWALGMLLCYGVIGAGFYCLARAFAPLPITDALELTGAFATAGVAGVAVLLAPSGLGVREGVLTILLAPILSPGVAAALALVARLWLTVAELLGALVALPALRRLAPRVAPPEAPGMDDENRGQA